MGAALGAAWVAYCGAGLEVGVVDVGEVDVEVVVGVSEGCGFGCCEGKEGCEGAEGAEGAEELHFWRAVIVLTDGLCWRFQ